MLIDLRKDMFKLPQDPVRAHICHVLGERAEIDQERSWVIYGLNLPFSLPHEADYPNLHGYHPDDTDEEYGGVKWGHLHVYGVVDTIEQWEEHYKALIDDPARKFFVRFFEVVKEEQPEDGGWRWHKWGPYLGTKDPQYEYIYDEGPEIERVYCFHVYDVTGIV